MDDEKEEEEEEEQVPIKVLLTNLWYFVKFVVSFLQERSNWSLLPPLLFFLTGLYGSTFCYRCRFSENCHITLLTFTGHHFLPSYQQLQRTNVSYYVPLIHRSFPPLLCCFHHFLPS